MTTSNQNLPPKDDDEKPLLSVSNLTTSFRRGDQWVPVVRDVSFHINPREVIAIVGESGSGKSVTSLSIMRLIPERAGKIEGSIRLGPHDMLGISQEQIQKVRGNDVAMIFQEPMTSLNPVMTVGAQIAESLMIHKGMTHGTAIDEAVRLLEKVRVPAARQRVNNFPHEFSGGMRQRVMIAIALACRPMLLIADEPTTALDVTIQAQVLELIKDLQRDEEMSVLFITHDMGVVAEIADRTIVMYDGRIVEQGDTRTILTAPQEGYTKSLLASVPRLGSMSGIAQPMRFPVVDRVNGAVDTPRQVEDTVRTDGDPILDVRNLTKRFDIKGGLLNHTSGRIHAVENVSFNLRAGETLALVGESGCGKSTTGRLLTRLVEPTSGAITLDGEDIMAARGRALAPVRQKIQMIFQDPFASLNPRLKVGQAIAEPLYIHKRAGSAEAMDIARQLLEQVGLQADMAGRFPHEFSGGQRQRICVARALALRPKVIVADEAVSALDVSVKAQVINLMLDLQQQMGLAYLFISHDMAAVERLSHRVAVMYLGEIIEIGPRQAVFSDPRHSYTRKLLDAVPVPDPDRLKARRAVDVSEIRTPLHGPDYRPPVRQYEEVSPGHFVQIEES